MKLIDLLGLLVRHFVICLQFFWVEVQLRFLCFLQINLVRIQIRLIRWSGLLLLAFVLTSCASRNLPPQTYAPSPAGVVRAVTAAKASAASLQREVTTLAGLRTLSDLNASLDASLTEVAAYSAKVDTVSVALTKAEESSNYWQGKQQKALRELTLWRGLAAVALSCLAAWLAWRIYKPSFA